MRILDLILTEMPIHSGGRDDETTYEMWEMQERRLLNLFKKGYKPAKCGGGLWKIETNISVYYWMQTQGPNPELTIISSFDKTNPAVKLPNAITIRSTVKWPGAQGVYASDMYRAILKDRPGGKIVGGDIMSDDSLKLWSRLLSQGGRVSIYDIENPQKLIPVASPAELKKYLVDISDDRYRFVLS